MSKGSRIALLIFITVLLTAAILSMAPEDSPLKTVSVLIITVIGTLSALAQFTGADAFRKLLEFSPRSRTVTSKELLTHLIARHLLVRCEAIGRRPIYPLDDNYWTNLVLDFPKLAREPKTLDLCASCLRPLLPLQSGRVFVVEPLDLGESQADVRQTITEIVNRLAGQFVRTKEIHAARQTVVLSGVFSSQIKDFLLQDGLRIAAAVFLFGPDAGYLSEVFKGFPFKIVSIVSTDTLQELDIETLRSILWYPD